VQKICGLIIFIAHLDELARRMMAIHDLYRPVRIHCCHDLENPFVGEAPFWRLAEIHLYMIILDLLDDFLRRAGYDSHFDMHILISDTICGTFSHTSYWRG